MVFLVLSLKDLSYDHLLRVVSDPNPGPGTHSQADLGTLLCTPIICSSLNMFITHHMPKTQSIDVLWLLFPSSEH